MNIAYHIERHRREAPDTTALIFEDASFTYRALDERTNRIANSLAGLGIERGERVALLLPNSPEFITAYLAIQKLGAIAVPLNVMLKRAEIKFIMDDCHAAAIITTETLQPEVPDRDLPALRYLLIVEGSASDAMALDDLLMRAEPEAPIADMAPSDPAAILYTSGTTGFPKGATLSHGNLVSNIAATNRHCGMRPDDRLLLFLPLFHCFGLNFILNSGLNAGATVVLQRRFSPDQALRAVAEQRITMFFGVPSVYITLLNRGVSGDDLSSVRYYFTAAAPMPVEIAQRWQHQQRLPIYEGYGLTETAPFASYNHDRWYKPGSIGTPIEHVEMRIVDGDGQDVATGAWGEIVIRGPNVMLGYRNRPAETAETVQNGWLRTGDIGVVDDEGYFYLRDRVKDMINTGGFKVYPLEVENALYEHPAVAEVAVYGISDPVTGEAVKADIVLKPGTRVSEAAITAFCRARIAAFKVPRAIDFVETIPKNATGKVLKRVLRAKGEPARMS